MQKSMLRLRESVGCLDGCVIDQKKGLVGFESRAWSSQDRTRVLGWATPRVRVFQEGPVMGVKWSVSSELKHRVVRRAEA